MHLMYRTAYSILYTKVYSTVYSIPYTILYTDTISGIDKYTVYLTEHSCVNLPLKCENNMMYSTMYTVSLIATNLCLMYTENSTVN